MRNVILIILIFMFCAGCGVKDDPKYNSQNNYNKSITLI